MILNHINLGVTDVPATVAMFETYFGLRRADGLPFGSKMAFLHDDSDALISVFKASDVAYPQVFHIGFMQPSREEVLRIHASLQSGGFHPEEPREEHGRFTFYFQAPGGFTVEVNTTAI
jgi:catechol 2,3-dioxygenase-like lactoylglutathione lyase family enzyme